MKKVQSGFYLSRGVRTELQKIKHFIYAPINSYSFVYSPMLPLLRTPVQSCSSSVTLLLVYAPAHLYSNLFMRLQIYTLTFLCSYSSNLFHAPTRFHSYLFHTSTHLSLVSQKRSIKTLPFDSPRKNEKCSYIFLWGRVAKRLDLLKKMNYHSAKSVVV